MKSAFTAIGFATVAGVANAASGPIVMTKPGSTDTCQYNLLEKDFSTRCGDTHNNPCPVVRKTADASACNKDYMLSYYNPYGNYTETLVGRVVEINANQTEDILISQWGWHVLCPFQCKADGACVDNPINCTNHEVVTDFVRDGYVIVGTANETALPLDIQWKSLDANKKYDNADNSANVTLVPAALETTALLYPTDAVAHSIKGSGFSCGVVITLDEVRDVECGTPENPCLVGSETFQNARMLQESPIEIPENGACGLRLMVNITMPGLTEADTSSPKICKDGVCPSFTVQKNVIIRLRKETQKDLAFLESPMGLWAGSLCPKLCRDEATGINVCVRTKEECIGTIVPDKEKPGEDGWGNYDEAGSMQATQFGTVVAIAPDAGAASTAAYTGLAFMAAAVAFALTF